MRYPKGKREPGTIINGWKIIKFDHRDKFNKSRYEFQCPCGNSIVQTVSEINKRKGCALCREKRITSPKTLAISETIVGTKYFNWTFMEIVRVAGNRKRVVKKCTCGTISKAQINKAYESKSCGCAWKRPVGDGHVLTKYPDKDIIAIRELLALNVYTDKEIRKMFNINKSYFWHLKHGRCRVNLIPKGTRKPSRP